MIKFLQRRAFSLPGKWIVLMACLLGAMVLRSSASSANTLVLVNSASSRYLDFRNYIQPYLDHFGIPYSVQDVRTNEVGVDIGHYALVVIGHAQFDTNHVFFDSAEQTNLVQAVAAGTGLVNFDSVLSGGGVVTNYQFVQEIFGFSYPGGSTGNFVYTANFFATEPAGQLHYIIARHPTNTLVAYKTAIDLLNVNAPAAVRVPARSGGQPLIAVVSHGQGRAVHWGTYDWVNMNIRGPLGRMDDLVWRSLIWAARKPFVMRGMPPMVSLRVDDTVGPSWWVGVANEVGMKPWLGPFITSMPATNISELRSYATNDLCTVAVHSFTAANFVFWNHDASTNWSDVEISNRMYWARQWHITNGIPLSKVVVPHTSEAGRNTFRWFKEWGSEFFTFVNQPGYSRISPWLRAGPFRKDVPTQPAQLPLPLSYADFLSIEGYPEFDGLFFNATTVIKDDSECGEWCPNNDVAASVGRGVRQLSRSFDSLVQGVLFTHEAYIQYNGVGPVYTPSITTTNWRTILQTITNQLAQYQPRYVTLDYASQYVRATRTARVSSAEFDPALGQMSMTFTGRADLELTVQIYVGEDNSITNIPTTIPAFTNQVVVVAQIQAAPPVLSAEAQSNLVKLTFTTTPGYDHRVEYRQQLEAGEWLPLTNFTAANTNATIIDSLVETQRLYRVRIPVN